MEDMSKELADYFNEISDGLGPKARYKKVVSDLKRDVNIYLSQHPNATMDKIYFEFGHPEDVIEDNVEIVPENKVAKAIMSPKQILALFMIFFIIILAFLLIFLVLDFIDGHYIARPVEYRDLSELTTHIKGFLNI